MIEVSTLTYLHKLKAKIQRELDEIEEENKEKQFKINQQIGKYDINNNKKKKKKKQNVEIEKNDENKNSSKSFESNEEKSEEEEEKTKINKEDLYNLEEFFVNKGLPNKTIGIASDKLASTIYTNRLFYSQNNGLDKNYKKNKKSKKKKNEYDIYL